MVNVQRGLVTNVNGGASYLRYLRGNKGIYYLYKGIYYLYKGI